MLIVHQLYMSNQQSITAFLKNSVFYIVVFKELPLSCSML